MRRTALTFLAAAALAACGDDEAAGVLTAVYELVPAATSFTVRQDLTIDLGVQVLKDGAELQDVLLFYSSDDVSVARVSADGMVTGLSGGTANIRVQGQTSSITIPVTVTAFSATSIELTVLSGPAGGSNIIGTRLTTNLDTGTFYGLPAHAGSSRLKAVVRVGTDTVYCNYCPPRNPARVFRLVNFRSLDESLATVSNASNPTVQGTGSSDAGVDVAGWVTVRDTSSEGVKIVLEVPGDDIPPDTVTLKLALRPINKLRVRPDSTNVPTNNGTGLFRTIWPGHNVNDTIQANAVEDNTTNFSVGVTFLSQVRNLPRANSSTSPTASSLTAWLQILPVGNVNVLRTNLPAITWESANLPFLSINAAGAIVAPCAFIGGACSTLSQGARNALVLNCDDNAGKIPGTQFDGDGEFTIPGCVGKAPITMPGAMCTTASDDDPTSTCSIWIRASATDPASGTMLSRLYRINVRN